MFAEIIIPLALPKNYTWSIPDHLLPRVQVGVRVEVSLKNKKYAGIVRTLHREGPEAFHPKPIEGVIDHQPIVQEAQLALWAWMADYYMCSEGEIMAAALPAHFKLSSETILLYNEVYGDDFSALDHDEYLVAEGLLLKKELRIGEIQQILDATHVYPVVRSLIDKGVCIVWEALQDTYKERREKYVLLHPDYKEEEKLADLMNQWTRAPKQLDLLLAYLHLQKVQGEVSQKDLLNKSGASPAQLKGLAEKNVLIIEQRQVDRLQYLPRAIQVDFELSGAQEHALGEVRRHLSEKSVCLLHGVTSSGKTLVYIKLIEALIKEGRQVLYLLPEIALTAQVIRRLQKHFGGYVGIYHSKFNQNERVEIWNKVASGDIRVVLGARSSLLLPFKDLGLIIVDEEHDASYKQTEPAPRYHARDTAIYYAQLHGARVLLGSATPSIESYYNAVQGKYGLVTLTERYGGAALPPIVLVDTRKVVREDKGKVLLSPALKDAIEGTVARDRQVILFQNRRGYTPYQVCATCGWIPECRNCAVTLTYHKASHKWQCHYCGTTYPVLHTCPACGGHRFIQKSFGTEKIEEVLQESFPGARVARMDLDTVRGKTAHDQLIHQFEDRRIDILVGTQMVVKGLDFGFVDLVGILDADSMLHFADFRVHERAFQLMEQVSGRAGRKTGSGEVMIQVSDTAHPVLNFVQAHDYKALYDYEIQSRQQFGYPPFSRLLKITFRHKLEETVMAGAEAFTGHLRAEFGPYLTGPAAPVVNRVRNQYLMELLIKLPRDGALIHRCKQAIRMAEALVHGEQRFRSVTVVPDVDPV
ncbi:replication restart helicase PriA [Dinghuibacter silviterrae]|uniref:Replication restart protein PriA n=1 Tax=Dinghuibacter silviterrae TaxID=1539049 RepID=A0A4R8DG51_9BACT|nr:primosomal protein N' [Dinghuibacter silviterrae]TDW96086.1 replication restart DNA helicase PriA [Dinghuibacter silviterrae]